MPKVLVLFCGGDADLADLAAAVAEGARSVRFTEADIRHVVKEERGPPAALASGGMEAGSPHAITLLENLDDLATYDAVVLGSPGGGGDMGAELRSLLDRAHSLVPAGLFRDRVGAAFTATPKTAGSSAVKWSILTALAALEMILVPGAEGDSADDPDAARAAALYLGRRVATVSEWVRHAKAHEHGHAHGHGHSH